MHVVHMLMIKSSSHFFNTFIDYKKNSLFSLSKLCVVIVIMFSWLKELTLGLNFKFTSCFSMFSLLQTRNTYQTWWYMPFIPASRRQRQEDFCKFEVCMESSRSTKVTQ